MESSKGRGGDTEDLRVWGTVRAKGGSGDGRRQPSRPRRCKATLFCKPPPAGSWSSSAHASRLAFCAAPPANAMRADCLLPGSGPPPAPESCGSARAAGRATGSGPGVQRGFGDHYFNSVLWIFSNIYENRENGITIPPSATAWRQQTSCPTLFHLTLSHDPL